MKSHWLLFLLLFPAGLRAQNSLDLAACIDYTLNHHPSLGIYQNNIEISQAKTTQAIAPYLPQINGGAAFQDNLILATTIIPAGVFGPNEARVQFGNQYTTNAYVDVTQTIFDQAKINGIKGVKPFAELSELEKEKQKEMLIYQTSGNFFQVLTLQQQFTDLSRTRKTYEDLLAIISVQVDKGVVDFRDRDRILISLHTVEFNIQEAEARLELAKNNLKNAMGMPLEAAITLDAGKGYDNLVQLPANYAFNPDQLYDYRIGQKNLQLQEVNVSTYKASYLPTVSANARVGSQAFSNDFGSAFAKWNNYSYIGLSVNVPIFSGLRRSGQVKEASLNLANAKINFDMAKTSLELQAQSANSALISAYNKVQTQRANKQLAQSVLESTTVKYEKGTASSTEFLNDDNAFQNAQNQYLSSQFSFMIARLDYEKAMGNLSEFYQNLNNQ